MLACKPVDGIASRSGLCPRPEEHVTLFLRKQAGRFYTFANGTGYRYLQTTDMPSTTVRDIEAGLGHGSAHAGSLRAYNTDWKVLISKGSPACTCVDLGRSCRGGRGVSACNLNRTARSADGVRACPCDSPPGCLRARTYSGQSRRRACRSTVSAQVSDYAAWQGGEHCKTVG
jgi:hypothetical protein